MKGLRGRRQKVQLVWAKRTDRAPHFVNMPKGSSGKEYIERRREKIYMVQYSMLTLPKYIHKIAISIKNIGLLEQLKVRNKEEKNRI